MNVQGAGRLPVFELLAIGNYDITGSMAGFVPHSLVMGQLLSIRVMQHILHLLPGELNQHQHLPQ
jgi:hypothetical protein